MDNAQPIRAIAETLDSAGLPVFCIDDSVKRHEIHLSVCAIRGVDGSRTWKYAWPEEFAHVCAASVEKGQPPPEKRAARQPKSKLDQCIPNKHGPKCYIDSDCMQYRDCLRCARSGFCTMQPLQY
jgi:hypothetical protein